MSAALYVIAILGCGEGDMPCEQVETAQARYESREACLAATETELARFGGLQFPIVVAECRREGEAGRRLMPSDVALPEPQLGPRPTRS